MPADDRRRRALVQELRGRGGRRGPVQPDFAQSCNTAFVSLASRLPADALSEAARDFGLGRDREAAARRSAGGQVPPGADLVERAAAMIGQARILASPLAMAGVAATVADGRWRAPRLLADDPHTAGHAAATPDDPRPAARPHAHGRHVGHRHRAGGAARRAGGKSGTAEYGSGDPPPTHAWFIAYRGDLAVAVLVEHGRSGGSVAAPIAARFFGALDGA